ncbi:MAG: AraC family transcriptional regulator [Actinomyces urogenitalis]|uniref:helix-turn-helix domain-containing protein n=1 Tax=Actinomyces urogenitalis TaxID=103621 RepID=UPI002A8266F8|nr:helix-turn-helix domain-containing protein [Actinomyces urogenitalis]MDY3679519.1 AraC family transcriptional regulator [Actinomyces urogenitalis]
MPISTVNLDDLTTSDAGLIADGFRGQRLSVLPAPIVRSDSQHPILAQLLVTDCGYYPHAQGHGFSRPDGTDQTIIILCAAGRGSCTVAGASHEVRPGDVVVIPARQPHAYAADHDEPWTIWWMHITGALVPSILQAGSFMLNHPVSRANDIDRCARLMKDVVESHLRDSTTASLMLSASAAWRMLTLVATNALSQCSSEDPVSGVATYIQQHPDKHLTLTEMADLARLSPSRFSALFRQQTGTSPLRYQVAQRMRRARELLDLSTATVSEIADHLGYSDHFYFTRQFSKEHGMSPRDYRRRAKG